MSEYPSTPEALATLICDDIHLKEAIIKAIETMTREAPNVSIVTIKRSGSGYFQIQTLNAHSEYLNVFNIIYLDLDCNIIRYATKLYNNVDLIDDWPILFSAKSELYENMLVNDFLTELKNALQPQDCDDHLLADLLMTLTSLECAPSKVGLASSLECAPSKVGLASSLECAPSGNTDDVDALLQELSENSHNIDDELGKLDDELDKLLDI
jgi:hypothetical protein